MKTGIYSRRGERGATLVEFSIVVSLLLLLLFGVIEMSRIVAEFTSIRTAAREGARYATTTESTGGSPHYRDCSGIIDAARARSVMGDTTQVAVAWSGPGFTHTCTQADPANDPPQNGVISGTTVTVTVTSDFEAIMPLIGAFLDNISLTNHQSREIYMGQTTS